MYIIVVGAGQIGKPLIEMAAQDRNEVVVIERDGERAEIAAHDFDCLVLNDDATIMETLEEAGGDRADALISTTDKDATNTMVCLLANEIGIPTVVSVVHNADHMDLFHRIGVHTIENPQRLIADYLLRGVTRPAVIDFMQLGDRAEIFEITVHEDAPIAGKTLREADDEGLLGEDMLVVAVEQPGDEPPVTPKGGTRIEAGDVLTVFSAAGATPTVTDMFGHYEDHDQSRR